jgi:hypothetical protein
MKTALVDAQWPRFSYDTQWDLAILEELRFRHGKRISGES